MSLDSNKDILCGDVPQIFKYITFWQVLRMKANDDYNADLFSI